MNVEILTHSQQQPQGPSSHKYKPTIRPTAESQCSVPPKGSWYTGSWSWMKAHVRKHSQQHLRCFGKTNEYCYSNRKLCNAHFPSSLLLLESELSQGYTDRDFRAM